MDKSDWFYQESGATDYKRLVLSYMIGLGITLVLGFIYSAITIIIPIIYFNFFIAVGFTILLGILCRILVRQSHNRNRRSLIIHAIVIGLLANYFQWTTYILYAFYGEIPTFTTYLSDLNWIVIPKDFLGSIIEINDIGIWSISGIVFSGFLLTLVWVVEGFIIMTGPIVSIYYRKTYPYSEMLNKWYPKYTLEQNFEPVYAGTQLIMDLRSDALRAIQKLDTGSGVRYSKIHIFYLNDEKRQYLTLEKFHIEGQGKGKRVSSIIFDNLNIDKQSAKSIMDYFEHSRERIKVV